MALQRAVFNLEFQIAYKLQGIEHQTKRLIEYRKNLVEIMSNKVSALDRKNFAVQQHLKYVDFYANTDNYTGLTYESVMLVKEEVAPLIKPDKEDASAVRFDALMYGLELAYLSGKKYTRSAGRPAQEGGGGCQCG
ncbi:MAG: hypothetical protein ACLTW9_16335 [Enterocloster sp.]